jgi:hypothetical protein
VENGIWLKRPVACLLFSSWADWEDVSQNYFCKDFFAGLLAKLTAGAIFTLLQTWSVVTVAGRRQSKFTW